MLTTIYFGIRMENIDVLTWVGVQRLVLEIECKNTFLHWDFGNHYLPFKRIEVNLHIKYTDIQFDVNAIILTIIYTYVTTTQNSM